MDLTGLPRAIDKARDASGPARIIVVLRYSPDDVFDLLLGAILARTFVPTVVHRNRPIERLVDLMLRLLRPACVAASQG